MKLFGCYCLFLLGGLLVSCVCRLCCVWVSRFFSVLMVMFIRLVVFMFDMF